MNTSHKRESIFIKRSNTQVPANITYHKTVRCVEHNTVDSNDSMLGGYLLGMTLVKTIIVWGIDRYLSLKIQNFGPPPALWEVIKSACVLLGCSNKNEFRLFFRFKLFFFKKINLNLYF